MDTLRDLDLVRAVPLRVQLVRDLPVTTNATTTSTTTNGLMLRADDLMASSMPTMVVRFSVFDTWYEIDSFWEGTFLERTVRGAFAKTMRESGDNVKVLFNHGMDFNIGDKMLGVASELREDTDAAVLEARLFDTSYNRDLLPGLEAGAYGSSFMFRVIRDEWDDEPETSESNPKGIPERTIKEVRLFEAGPVTWPANPAATAGVRSMTDEYYERLRMREPQRYDELRARVLSTRTPNVDAAPLGTSTDGAAPAPTDAPAPGHPSGLTPRQRREALYPFLRKAS
jgi:HK97 family phage prohead protease